MLKMDIGISFTNNCFTRGYKSGARRRIWIIKYFVLSLHRQMVFRDCRNDKIEYTYSRKSAMA